MWYPHCGARVGRPTHDPVKGVLSLALGADRKPSVRGVVVAPEPIQTRAVVGEFPHELHHRIAGVASYGFLRFVPVDRWHGYSAHMFEPTVKG